PPTYEEQRKWEAELPQHNLELPFPEGRTGRYVKFSNQARFIGWNNCFNEELMNLHLAYMSGRAYVFSEYVWAPQHYQWPDQQPEGGARTPLSAIVSGPLAGGPWAAGDPAPRSVSEAWFDVVCPPQSRRLIRTPDVKSLIRDAPGDALFAHWQQLLLHAPEGCIEIVPPPYEEDSFPQTFDLSLWGSTRILALWDSFSTSPTSRLLGPSPIVLAALERNQKLFLPRGSRAPTGPGAHDPLARMLAVHIRRGDFLEHCRNLAGWGSSYYSWAQLAVLPDKFAPAPADDPRRVEKALAHCLPEMPALVQLLRDARADYVRNGTARALDVIYLLTNEAGEWLDGFKVALRQDGWTTIVASPDLRLDAQQTDVSMAIDMEIARRAAVFVGNGWSSFTSNIIHQRLVDGREPISIRL
ncbi:hypothetical protein B0H15DRAFT_751878, partial [Mycena belliarum]